jgi:acyl carrier protein
MDSAEIREALVKILVEDFRIPATKIKDEGTFRGTFGMDSLDAVDFVFLVKKTFGIEAELQAFSQVHSLAALVGFVESELAKKST